MANINIQAYVHHVENAARGFIYANLLTDRDNHYIRIASADENGHIQIFLFGRQCEMLGDAEMQSKLNDNLVRAEEDLVKKLDFVSKSMLIEVLMEQHPYLFKETKQAC